MALPRAAVCPEPGKRGLSQAIDQQPSAPSGPLGHSPEAPLYTSKDGWKENPVPPFAEGPADTGDGRK